MPGPAGTLAAVAAPEDDATEREIDAVVAAGDESRDAPVEAAPGPAPIPSAADIQRIVSGLAVKRTANGGLVIQALPETASTLGAPRCSGLEPVTCINVNGHDVDPVEVSIEQLLAV